MKIQDMSFKKAWSLIGAALASLFLLVALCWMVDKYAAPMVLLFGIAFVLWKPGAIKSFGVKATERVWAVIVFTTIFVILQAILGALFSLPVGSLYSGMTEGESPVGFVAFFVNHSALSEALGHMAILLLAWLMTKHYLNPVGKPEVVVARQAGQRKMAIVTLVLYLSFTLTPLEKVWNDQVGYAKAVYNVAGNEAAEELAKLKLDSRAPSEKVTTRATSRYEKSGEDPAKVIKSEGEEIPEETMLLVFRKDTDGDDIFDDYKTVTVDDVVYVEAALVDNPPKKFLVIWLHLGDKTEPASDNAVLAQELLSTEDVFAKKIGSMRSTVLTHQIIASSQGYTPSRVVPYPGDKIRFGPFDNPQDVDRLVIQVGHMTEVDLDPLPFLDGQWIGEVTISPNSGINTSNMPEKVRVKYGTDLPLTVWKVS